MIICAKCGKGYYSQHNLYICGDCSWQATQSLLVHLEQGERKEAASIERSNGTRSDGEEQNAITGRD